MAAVEPPRVVLVTKDERSELATLLGAELRALGFLVVLVPPERSGTGPRDLTALARQQGAVAAFRISVTSDRVEVWVADRVTGKVSLRDVIRRRKDDVVAARVIVLRSVELLRWSLQELRAPHPPRGEIVKPPPEVVDLARGSSSPLVLTVGAAPQGFYLSGASLGAGLELGASIRVGRWGGQVLFGQPLVAGRLSNDRGRVEIRPAWAGVEATWDAAPPDAALQPRLGLGVRGFSMELTGVVQAPLIGTSSRDYAFAPVVHPACVLRLTQSFQLFAAASVAWMLRRTQLDLAGEPAGNLGGWLTTAGVGIRVAVQR